MTDKQTTGLALILAGIFLAIAGVILAIIGSGMLINQVVVFILCFMFWLIGALITLIGFCEV